MLLDSSAIVAVVLREPGWEMLHDQIDNADVIAISTATLLETHLVLTNRIGSDALPILDAFTRETEAQMIPFSEAHWRRTAMFVTAKGGIPPL